MEFQEAATKVTQLSQRPDNDTLLKLYGLFKQGSQGNATGKRPGMIDFKGRAKFDAWKKLEGMEQTEAQQQYITLVQQLVDSDG